MKSQKTFTYQTTGKSVLSGYCSPVTMHPVQLLSANTIRKVETDVTFTAAIKKQQQLLNLTSVLILKCQASPTKLCCAFDSVQYNANCYMPLFCETQSFQMTMQTTYHVKLFTQSKTHKKLIICTQYAVIICSLVCSVQTSHMSYALQCYV